MADQVLAVRYHFDATDRATTVHFQGALLLVDGPVVVTVILPGRRAFYADARTVGSVVGRIIEAKAKGHLRGKQPKLNHRQEAHLVSLLDTGEYTTADLADLFGVARSTVYRAVERERILKAATVSTPTPGI
jgi:hypothetical protein